MACAYGLVIIRITPGLPYEFPSELLSFRLAGLDSGASNLTLGFQYAHSGTVDMRWVSNGSFVAPPVSAPEPASIALLALVSLALA